jgi:hypothetical protein
MNAYSCPSAADQPAHAEGAPVDRQAPSVPQSARIGITTRDIDWLAVSCDCEPHRPRYSVRERREAQNPVLLQLFWRAEEASSYAAELVDAGRDAFPMPEGDRFTWGAP